MAAYHVDVRWVDYQNIRRNEFTQQPTCFWSNVWIAIFCKSTHSFLHGRDEKHGHADSKVPTSSVDIFFYAPDISPPI